MKNEIIGYAELTMNAHGYSLYEVTRDHEAKCISIRKVSEVDDSLPFFGRQLPRYDDEAYVSLRTEINSQKAAFSPEIRWTVPVRSRSARWNGFKTTASRPDLSHIKDVPRRMGDRKSSKQMSQAEVKRLLAEALGMEGDE